MIGTIIAKKTLRKAYMDLNNHNLDEFIAGWHEEAVFTYPGEIWCSGTFKGKPAIKEWFHQFFEQYPGIRFELQLITAENGFAFSGNNVFMVYWNIFLTNKKGREGENNGVSLITLKDGKVNHVKDFIFDLGENFRLNWEA